MGTWPSGRATLRGQGLRYVGEAAMNSLRPAAAFLDGLSAYDPKYLPAKVYLNANESAYGLPASVKQRLADALAALELHRYPDPLVNRLRQRLAEARGVDKVKIMLGNGGDELIYNIMLAYGGPGRKLLIAPPSFSSYEIDARLTATEIVALPRVWRGGDGDGGRGASTADSPFADGGQASSPAVNNKPGSAVLAATNIAAAESPFAGLVVDEAAILERVAQGDIDIVMLASPNNPTGEALSPGFVTALLNASDALVLIDQAYLEFADPSYDLCGQLAAHANLAILRTFSKAYALAGLRLGYLMASEPVIGALCKLRQPYSVNSFSALAGELVLDAAAEIAADVANAVAERGRLAVGLAALPGVTVLASDANFILFRLAQAQAVWQRLYDEWGILLRDFSTAPYLAGCLRASVGTAEENQQLLRALALILPPGPATSTGA